MSKRESAEIVAFAKALTDRSKEYLTARDDLAPGRYDVDATFHVSGEIGVGADSDVAAAGIIPGAEALALMLEACGPSDPAKARALLKKVIKRALAKDKVPAVEMAMVEEAKQEVVAKLPRQPRRGSVTANLDWQPVEWTPPTEARPPAEPKKNR
jgi:hypothetical protein